MDDQAGQAKPIDQSDAIMTEQLRDWLAEVGHVNARASSEMRQKMSIWPL
jgi:hypothetical protein